MAKASKKKRRSAEHEPEHRTKTEANEQLPNTEQRTREENDPPAGGPRPDLGSVGDVPERLVSEQVSLTDQNEAPEKSSVLAHKMIDLMKKMRLANFPMHEIAKILKVSSSTVYFHTKDVVPTPQATESTLSSPPPSSLPQTIPSNENGGERFDTQRVPKLSSEIVGVRPRIVEDNQGYSGNNNGDDLEQTRPSPSVLVDSNGGPSRPVTVLIRPDDPGLQDVIIELLHLSASRGVAFGKYLSSGMAVEDLRDCAFAKTVVLGDGEDFRRNLLMTAQKSNLHDRYRRDAGLDVSGVEDS